jgi:hypothetical protein
MLTALLVAALRTTAGAQDYGQRLGEVRRGGEVS